MSNVQKRLIKVIFYIWIFMFIILPKVLIIPTIILFVIFTCFMSAYYIVTGDNAINVLMGALKEDENEST